MFFEGRKLTAEQERVVRHVPNRRDQKIVINAYAGCGKTTTLRALVHFKQEERQNQVMSMSDEERAKRFLYIVYNVEMEKAARESFQDDSESVVKICTNHALALAFMKHHLKELGVLSSDPNSQPKFEFDDRGMIFGKSADVFPNIIKTLENFCQDPSFLYTEPQPFHVPTQVQNEARTLKGDSMRPDAVLTEARTLWHDAINLRKRMQKPVTEGSSKMEEVIFLSYDVVLKYFSVYGFESQQYIHELYHTMLVDEAQDVQFPLLSWILDRVTLFPIYLVGDTHQSIYAFTGAHDAIEKAMEHPKSVLFYLSQSFRFGSKIAQLATSVLQQAGMMDSDKKILGNDAQQGTGTVHVMDHTFTADMADQIVRSVHAKTGSTDISMLSRNNNCILQSAIYVYTHGYHVRLTGAILKWMQTAVKLLSRFKSTDHASQHVGTLIHRRKIYEDEQIKEHVRRKKMTGEEAFGILLTEFFEHDCYSEGGFYDGSHCMSEWEKFEWKVLDKCGDRFLAMQQLFKGMIEQTEAKVIPPNTVVVTFGTVYSSKGNEWHTVVLMDDFADLDLNVRVHRADSYSASEYKRYMEEHSQEIVNSASSTKMSMNKFFQSGDKVPVTQEVHLCYVALTRAKVHVFVNSGTARFLQQFGYSYPQHVLPDTVRDRSKLS